MIDELIPSVEQVLPEEVVVALKWAVLRQDRRAKSRVKGGGRGVRSSCTRLTKAIAEQVRDRLYIGTSTTR